MSDRTFKWASVVISWTAGFFLMFPLVFIFNVFNWPFFNGGHGSVSS